MRLIKLTKGYWAKVDNKDFEWLSQWKWCIDGTGYAKTTFYDKEKYKEVGFQKRSKASITIHMHVLVNETPKGFETDHINQDKLDNRRKNLRTVSKSLNLLNGKVRVDNKSGFRGVFWVKERDKWRAYVDFKRKRYYLGDFLDKEEAILARKEKEKAWLVRGWTA